MPILMSKQEYDRIVKWTDPNKEDPEAARVREYISRLQKQSAEMTKTWPNSLENINKRSVELRQARIQAAEDTNARFYRNYIRRNKAKQERMMYSARDTVFKNTDAPKLLLGGVIESVVLKEREEQIKFDKTRSIQVIMAEKQKEHEQLVLKQAKEWHQLMADKQKKRREINKQHQKELIEQRDADANHRRSMREEHVRQEQMDIENAAREMEMIRKSNLEFKENERQRIWKDNTQSVKEVEDRRNETKNREMMDDLLIEVLKKSQCRVEQKRRDTLKRLQNEKLMVLEAISKRLESNVAARDAQEEESFEKASAQKTAAVEARHQAQLDKIARQNREKRAQREQFLKDEKQRLHEEHTMNTFAIMNRFKNAELYADYINKRREENEAKKKKYKEDILAQDKEVKERNAKAEADLRHFYGEFTRQKFRNADNKLFVHAAALLEEAKTHGRPIRPILKALDMYCKVYRLYPMPDLPKSMQEHFKGYKPWDGSKMDPWYKPPPLPPPASACDPDAPDEDTPHKPPARTDGLQDLAKGASAKPAAAAPADYKRQGRANGLQQKPKATPKEAAPQLPPVVRMPPCAMHECLCNIKSAL